MALLFKNQIYVLPGVCCLHMIIVQHGADPQPYHIDELNDGTVMLYLERMV